jgi:uncharacterized membrane-anchored protein
VVRTLALFVSLSVAVANLAAAAPANQEAQLKAAWDAARKTATLGPAEIKLLDQASLTLADDQAFVPAAEANQIMDALGNGRSTARQGLIVSRRRDAQWMIDVKWVDEGYVRDGDAKEWQADALLDSLREGTENGNAERLARGLPALEVVGWVEPPAYDAAAHRLVWSLALNEKGAPADRQQTINYNTYALGRDGFFSLDLVTFADTIALDKDVVRQLLGTLAYGPGKRYEDFDQSTDKVAAYGLAALIGAVAVKKLGLLALAAAFFVKIWKVGMIAVFGAFAAVRRILKGRRRSTPDSPPANS